VVGRIRFALERFGLPRHSSHVAQLFSLDCDPAVSGSARLRGKTYTGKMRVLTIPSALRSGHCGASELAAASDLRSGAALGQEGWATQPKVGQVFLRTTATTGGSQSNQPLEPIPMGCFRLASMIQLIQIVGAVWLSFGR